MLKSTRNTPGPIHHGPVAASASPIPDPNGSTPAHTSRSPIEPSELVKLASRFRSDISVVKDEMSVNGKSIMGVMTLAAECGSALVIRADGDDAEAAASALAALVARGFSES